MNGTKKKGAREECGTVPAAMATATGGGWNSLPSQPVLHASIQDTGIRNAFVWLRLGRDHWTKRNAAQCMACFSRCQNGRPCCQNRRHTSTFGSHCTTNRSNSHQLLICGSLAYILRNSVFRPPHCSSWWCGGVCVLAGELLIQPIPLLLHRHSHLLRLLLEASPLLHQQSPGRR